MDIAQEKCLCSQSGKDIICKLKDNAFDNVDPDNRFNNDRYPFLYSWKRDYPVSLQEQKEKNQKKKSSFFSMSFQPEKNEVAELENELKISFNKKQIIITLSMGKKCIVCSLSNEEKLSVKQFKGIVKYITKRTKVCYIDPIRTANSAMKLINSFFEAEMRDVYKSKDYLAAENELSKFLLPPIHKLSQLLDETLKNFIPSIQDNSLTFYHSNRPLHDLHVLFNDGSKTSIFQKGSGIQSVVALSLAQRLYLNHMIADNFIIAIEEPEAHLHPKAIHEIKKILSDIAKHNQLIITTHSPLLINTDNVKSNIIVSRNNAHPASGLKEVRETLGVLASDNLLFADNNVFVEGESDSRILKRLLPEVSRRIKQSLENGTLFIVNCQGATRISSFVAFAKSCICMPYIILDNDSEGKREKEKIIDKNPELEDKITMFSKYKMKYSELEDLVDPMTYIDRLMERFQWTDKKSLLHVLEDSNQAWSERLLRFSEDNGHPFADEDKDLIHEKTIVADAIVEKGLEAICSGSRKLFVTLANNIEKMLDE